MREGSQATPTIRSVLDVLPKSRLVDVGRHFSVGLSGAATKEEQLERLQASGQVRMRNLVEWMARDELRRACERHGLDGKERARARLAALLLEAFGSPESGPPQGLFGARHFDRLAPRAGDIAQVRQRQYLVEKVHPPQGDHEATVVDLVCLDDDNQGRPLSVLWELELGARVLHPQEEGLGAISRLDPAPHFAAYLHALRWNSVTATDARLFQSPFRAGIKLLNHQLTPLKKALELPRANLFIADDVGLGKTIEAGLVLQELELRQRVDFMLIVCPAAISLQWKREMEKRFGQRFAIHDRDFVAQRRRERGFGVPAWATHNRFIISYQTLRRPEYFEPLIQHLGPRLKKSLIVLDEAHTAAPASSSKYAIDSRVTRIVRDLAPRFENRLFLSATPHNGHSNSFSALMEILDPQRFTRGVPIDADSGALDQVMVRRLKRDLRDANLGVFPTRHVVRVSLEHAGGEDGAWSARYESKAERGKDRPLGTSAAAELRLSDLLAQYTELMKPKKGRGQLVFINLQKRLLSSVEAFYRTLEAHADRLQAGKAKKEVQLDLTAGDEPDDTIDSDEDQHDRDADVAVATATSELKSPTARARELLDEMLTLARKHRAQPDAKVLALLDWIREHQCPAVQAGGPQGKGKALKWEDRRLLIFTEYADTKRYLTRMLDRAIEGTHLGEERVMGFHGAMGEEQRDQVQRHFNGAPSEYPVRILIATDAAREGLNLQNHCSDLFHFDIPWNPARMEQRNGRIDRTLQPSPEVRCHYFHYEARREDAVLRKLVTKVDVIQDELGSLGDVVMQRMERVLDRGIDDATEQALDTADPDPAARLATEQELEAQRMDIAKLKAETDDAAKILNQSRQLIEFKPELLRDVVNVGLELAGTTALEPIEVDDELMKGQEVFQLPDLPDSWTETLDSLRPPRERGEDFIEWRKQPPQPVVFRPLDRIGEERVHLHLEHPFVQRILSRFLSQGYSAQNLTRVTVVPNPDDALVRVVAFGRVSLFGRGAARLHDELVSVAAQWLESKGKGHLRPFADEADRRALSTLERLFHEAPRLGEVPASIHGRLLESASEDFKTLWKHVRDEADDRAHAASQKLAARGAEEAAALKNILERQRQNIERELSARQLNLFDEQNPDAKKQWEGEKEHMQKRLGQIEKELDTEPGDIEALYQVCLKRLEPVGLVYLWPTTRM